MKKFKSIGLVVKHHQPKANQLAIELSTFLLENGFEVLFSKESEIKSKMVKGIKVVANKSEMIRQVDLMIVLGGDGTYLSVARLMDKRSIPILGVNLGTLGFLTEVKRDEVMAVLRPLLFEGKYTLSERKLFEVELWRGKKRMHRGLAVNDVVISKGAIARIIGLEISINQQPINFLRADGLIVSTPTGSTAYSLAAGGPILQPALGALILTPICPHSLTQRPLVLTDDVEIEIRLAQRPGHVVLTLDGQDVVDLSENDVVRVKKFNRHQLKLVSNPARDYFQLLREKLQFGFKPA